ncbi:SIR2 family protein [Spiroplasma endosymbiont of Dioctria linearis]|uniref:SIR2 family protein n=1 Tax=Spiroplasma endosymbiont of Dioctria linearis TaxID=3066290 RepID=UPI00313CAE06
MNNNKKILLSFEEFKRILSSNNLHFVIGAGFNNGVLPLASDLKKTIKGITKIVNSKTSSITEDFESWMDDMISESEDKVKDEIINSFFENIKMDLELDNLETYDEIVKSLKNSKMDLKLNDLEEINSFIVSLKKLNINKNKGNGNLTQNKKTYFWTLNYDNLLQKILLKNKMPSYIIDKEGFDENVFNYTVYHDSTKTFIPTYYIQKIHGNKNEPIIPGRTKYSNFLSDMKIFKGYINMRNLLDNKQGKNIIFVIGYSFGDKHINEILRDSFNDANIIINMEFFSNTSNGLVSNILEEEKDFDNVILERINKSEVEMDLYSFKTSNVFKTLKNLFSLINNDNKQINERD